MEFFNAAIDLLKTLVIALGAGLGVWGTVNLLEAYGNDNPGAPHTQASWRAEALSSLALRWSHCCPDCSVDCGSSTICPSRLCWEGHGKEHKNLWIFYGMQSPNG